MQRPIWPCCSRCSVDASADMKGCPAIQHSHDDHHDRAGHSLMHRKFKACLCCLAYQGCVKPLVGSGGACGVAGRGVSQGGRTAGGPCACQSPQRCQPCTAHTQLLTNSTQGWRPREQGSVSTLSNARSKTIAPTKCVPTACNARHSQPL